jgi:hypothetical protein
VAALAAAQAHTKTQLIKPPDRVPLGKDLLGVVGVCIVLLYRKMPEVGVVDQEVLGLMQRLELAATGVLERQMG